MIWMSSLVISFRETRLTIILLRWKQTCGFMYSLFKLMRAFIWISYHMADDSSKNLIWNKEHGYRVYSTKNWLYFAYTKIGRLCMIGKDFLLASHLPFPFNFGCFGAWTPLEQFGTHCLFLSSSYLMWSCVGWYSRLQW